jgi:hypothetical protein
LMPDRRNSSSSSSSNMRFHGTGRAFNASPMAFLVTGTDFYSSVYKHLLQELSTE